MEGGDLRYLMEIVCKKAKRNLERSCEGGGWITILRIFQDSTDLSREGFGDALQLVLDIPFQYPPLTCDFCSESYMVEHE